MRREVGYILLLMAFMVSVFPPISGKKVKYSLTINKEEKVNKSQSPGFKEKIPGIEVNIADSLNKGVLSDYLSNIVGFAGYDKEANSNIESFLVLNHSDQIITGFKVKIDYLDLKGRMLHSRTVESACMVPSGESRRVDIKSWDLQHTYYYYLGNEPKKVATPFKVEFFPQIIWIEEKEK